MGRRPVRPQMHTALAEPSLRNSGFDVVTRWPSVKSSPTELPITRSGGIPCTSEP